MNRYAYSSGVFKKPPRAVKKRTKTQREASAHARVIRHPEIISINSLVEQGMGVAYIFQYLKLGKKRLHLPHYVIRAYINQYSK